VSVPCSSLRAEYPDGFNVLAVGFASFVMNLVAVDEVGAAVTPVFTYARNSQALAALARELRNDPRLQQVHQRVGTVIHSSYANVQLTHHYRDSTQLVDKITWQTVASYLLARWTGCATAPCSTSEASWTGLLNVKTGSWDASVVEACGILLQHLPQLVDAGDCMSAKLTPQYAARWPELQTARLHFGLGDGAAANLGSQCEQFGRVAVTIGTSAAARVILPASSAGSLKIPDGLWCYRVDNDRLLLGGALTDGGSAVAWFRDVHRVSDNEFSAMEQEIEQQLRTLKAPTVFALPFFGGERSPGWVDDATASFHGITRSTRRADLLRAIMEGICFRLKEILLRIDSGVHQASGDAHEPASVRLVVSGGALEQSTLWRFMLSQISGKPVFVVHAAAELTSVGVGQLLLSRLWPSDGASKLVQDVGLHVDSEPRPDIVRMYDSAFAQHRKLYRRACDPVSNA
jgi:gluconokinase